MQTEVEVKFLDINLAEIRAKLRQIGAKLITPERLMRRVNFESPVLSSKSAWVRVRDEGSHITVTYKQTIDQTVTGTREVNLEVDSYQAAVDFLNAIGLEEKSEQETKRESWELGDVQIELDTWPWLNPFIELEGPSVAALKQTAGKLGFIWDEHLAGDVTAVYQKNYTFAEQDLYHNPIRFGPVPSWLEPHHEKTY